MSRFQQRFDQFGYNVGGPSDSKNQKRTWQIFVDLQCPYSKKCYAHLDEFKQSFGNEFDISVHVTSLVFHPQAFKAQCCHHAVRDSLGPSAGDIYMKHLFQEQKRYMNDAAKDMTPDQVLNVLADIAAEVGIFDEGLSRAEFLQHSQDWESTTMPAYKAHKFAVSLGVFGTPTHVIDGSIVTDTDSEWGPEEWASKLSGLPPAPSN